MWKVIHQTNLTHQANNVNANDRQFTHQSTVAGIPLTIQYVYEF